ncbi:MAG: F0F1 ATP synthase subunit B [Bacteroidales bacterium]|nr:F0F1 ATP synthase subunit B [Bacteroidales bacterium]
MDLITPGIGLVFWMFLTFLTVLFLLKKFAWKPILNSLKEREDSIENALKAADDARAQMEQLQSDNEKILAKAREERDSLLKEARETQELIISESKAKAKEEADKLIKAAQISIENEKNAAVESMKIQIVSLSVEIAEKILRKQLEDAKAQNELISELVKDIKLN